MAKNKDINIRINAKENASGVFSRVGKSVGVFESRIMRAGHSIGALPAAMGLGGLVLFSKQAIEAAAEQEAAEAGLAAALKQVGTESRGAMEDSKEFASWIQRLTVIGDEATLKLMALGATAGNLAGKDLRRATMAAIGLSRAFKIDTEAAMRLVTRAAQGNTSALARYGIEIDSTLPLQERFNQLLRIGERNFALATAEAKTAAGSMQQLRNAWGDTLEVIGRTPDGTGNALSGMAEGIGAINAALADTDSRVNRVGGGLIDLWMLTPHARFGDWLGEWLTEDQVNLGPSQTVIESWQKLSEAQRRAISEGRSLPNDLPTPDNERLDIERQINAVIRGERADVLRKELEKLTEAEGKEQTRLNTVEAIRDRYAELSTVIAEANAEQAKAISQQLAGLRQLLNAQNRLEQQRKFKTMAAFGNAIEQEQFNRLRDRAEGGDRQAEIEMAREQASAAIKQRIAALDKFGADDSLPLETRNRAQEMIRELMGTIEGEARKRAADLIRERHEQEDKQARSELEDKRKAGNALPELISGRLLTGMTAAFRSGQERKNPNKGVEDRVDGLKQISAEMLRTMQDMRAVLRAGGNPILKVGRI